MLLSYCSPILPLFFLAGLVPEETTVTLVYPSQQSQSSLSPDRINPVNQKNYDLVWSDEFNTEGLPDSAKWSYDLGNGPNGWGNAEQEFYTKRIDNVYINDGILHIKAIRENFEKCNFTSARIKSKGKFEFMYGRVEARAKLPAGAGTWPAIWMLGSDIGKAGWPKCGEIDIMEHVGRDPDKIYGTLHYPGRSGGNADGNTKITPGVTDGFHIYTLDWDKEAIRIYVDDELVHTVPNSSAIPFNHKFFLLINLAMGGNFGGAVDPDLSEATLEVDYIRVYQ